MSDDVFDLDALKAGAESFSKKGVSIMNPTELKDLMKNSVVGASMLSRHLGVSRSTVYRWLDGEVPISKMAEVAIRSVLEDIKFRS